MANALATPSYEVLKAFDPNYTTSKDLDRLPGGMGTSWQCEGLILKPVDSVAETNWTSALLAGLPSCLQSFRRSEPIASTEGEWVVDGWCAQRFLPGISSQMKHNQWKEMLEAARSFHELLKYACLTPPTFLEERTHKWAQADRIVWSDNPPQLQVEEELSDLVIAMFKKRHPLSQATRDSTQLVHCDIAGNVLFAPGLPPAIIDFTPYWRPQAYAEAMIVIDGMLWYGAPSDLLATPANLDAKDWKGLLVRALLFRALTLDFIIKEHRKVRASEEEVEIRDEIECFRRVTRELETGNGSP
jgi:uncharacterized protein (TIGR02569 family)